jgi:hypothetical protein
MNRIDHIVFIAGENSNEPANDKLLFFPIKAITSIPDVISSPATKIGNPLKQITVLIALRVNFSILKTKTIGDPRKHWNQEV